MLLSQAAEHSWLPIGGAAQRAEGAALRYIQHCSMAAGMPLLPSALPPKGEARRYVVNDFLNLIALGGLGGFVTRDQQLGIRSFSRVFIPLEPYPARYACHLPHAGKAVVRGIVCILPPSLGRRCPEGAEVGSAAV